jgi:hypothetical protein
VSVAPLPRGAVDSFDHPGLFLVPLDRPRAPLAAKTVDSPVMRHGGGRVAPNDRHKRGLHRYCSGCANETEHVVWAREGQGSIPSIRWPGAEPAAGTTICLNCGQRRGGGPRPSPPAWSEWPRTRIATRPLAAVVALADTANDWASETAAENEGMPPKPEPGLQTRNTRVRRLRLVARSHNGGVKRRTRSGSDPGRVDSRPGSVW